MKCHGSLFFHLRSELTTERAIGLLRLSPARRKVDTIFSYSTCTCRCTDTRKSAIGLVRLNQAPRDRSLLGIVAHPRSIGGGHFQTPFAILARPTPDAKSAGLEPGSWLDLAPLRRGPLKVARSTYRQVGLYNGPTVVPLDLKVGFLEGLSPLLAKSVALGYSKGRSAATSKT